MASANVRRVIPHSGTFQLLLALFCALFAAHAAQAAKLFPLNSFSYYISDYENDLKGVAKLVNKPMADLATELAASDAANNPRLSAVTLEKMITLQPKDAALWLKLAERLAVAQPINDEDKYRLPSKVIGAKSQSLSTRDHARGRSEGAVTGGGRICQPRRLAAGPPGLQGKPEAGGECRYPHHVRADARGPRLPRHRLSGGE
ncbi:hypothetical protein [Aestuariivirga sp.]|uniref:hypothetical protein n=1 Tax=Aestuariivirga sp. TaxID=2650926 RepID=UPI0039E54745